MQHIKETRQEDTLGTVDTDWVESKQRQVAAETERLELELKGYKNNLIKESIRVSAPQAYNSKATDSNPPDGQRRSRRLLLRNR